MSTKRILARNLIWNWGGTFVTMATGFIVAPFLMAELGNTIYGLWIQIASLTNFFGFLDLGIRGAVGRNVAFLRAKNDFQGINAVLNTALSMLAGLACIAMLAVLLYSIFFFDLFDVRPDLTEKVQWTLLIIGLNLALVLIFNAFDAVLWGFQRFDLLNLVDIPTALFRAGFVFYLIGIGKGLITLGLITLVLTLYSGLLKMWFSFRIAPFLSLRRVSVTSSAARQLFGYGIWYFILSMSRLFNIQIGPQLISNRLGFAAITPFNASVQLIRAAGAVMVAATGVLMPLATAYHATHNRDSQRNLFLEGSKMCTALSLFFLTVFLLLGQPIMTLWLKRIPEAKDWFPLLVILALGEALPMTQMVTWNILLGMARHPLLAVWSLIENFVAIPLSIILINHSEALGAAIVTIGDTLGISRTLVPSEHYGLAGFGLAFAIPAFVCRGIFPILFGCQLLKVDLLQYFRRVLVPALLMAIPPAIGLAALCLWSYPVSWPRLIAYAVSFSVAYFVLFGWILIGWDRIRDLFRTRIEPAPEQITARS